MGLAMIFSACNLTMFWSLAVSF